MLFFKFLIFLLIFFFLLRKIKILINKRNKKLLSFKSRLLSKESKIEKIFSRQDEKTFLDPNINIQIDITDKEQNILRKANIHRARLAKYKKSKLNGELLFEDNESNLYKIVGGVKIFVD